MMSIIGIILICIIASLIIAVILVYLLCSKEGLLSLKINKVSSGYLCDGRASYVYNFIPGKNKTLVWISGGGVACISFAFSGVGPFHTYDGINIKNNPWMLQDCSQLFIDAGLWKPESSSEYLDKIELENLLCEAILEAKEKLKFRKIIICGVSYGAKLALEVQKKLSEGRDKSLISRTCIGITPFYDPYHSMAFIPSSPLRFGYYLPSKESIYKLFLLRKII